MSNPVRGAFPLRIVIALAAALPLLGAAAPAGAACPSTPTWTECRAAWYDSSAQETCLQPEIHVAGSKCSVNANCLTGINEYAREWASIEACVGDIPDLSNCNASLRVGSC